MITVGTNQLSYNQIRNFAGLPFNEVKFRKAFDVYKIPAFIKFKLFNKVDYNLVFKFNDFGLNRDIDMFHFFNTITPVRKPWVVTYETSLPRPDGNFYKGYEWMAGKYCRKIIAYTERAFKAQQKQLLHYPEFQHSIEEKMMVLPPSQNVVVSGIDHKAFDQEIQFVFTGSAFYRKGGYELVKAFERCRHKKLPVKLTIISKMEIEGYCDVNITQAMQEETGRLIAENPLITHYRGLPNTQVMQILQDAHVGVLPSFGETFGYSLLEAMACGCAVVSTSVSPFPEFVRNEVGYMLYLPTEMKKVEYIDIDNPTKYAEISDTLVAELFNTVEAICNNRQLLKEKCLNAIQYIAENYNPMDRVAVLQQVYKDAMEG